MDYRALLKKYIRHVGSEEGISFLEYLPEHHDRFTKEEQAELEKLDAECVAESEAEYDSYQKEMNPTEHQGAGISPRGSRVVAEFDKGLKIERDDSTE